MKISKIKSMLFYCQTDNTSRNKGVFIPTIEQISNDARVGDIILSNKVRYRLIAKYNIPNVFVGEVIDDLILPNKEIKLGDLYIQGRCYFITDKVVTSADPRKFKLFKI